MSKDQRFRILRIDSDSLNVGGSRSSCVLPDGMAVTVQNGQAQVEDLYLYRLMAEPFNFSGLIKAIESTFDHPDTISVIKWALSRLTDVPPNRIDLSCAEHLKFKIVASAYPAQSGKRLQPGGYFSNVMCMEIPSSEKLAFFVMKVAVGELPVQAKSPDYFKQVYLTKK